MRVLDRHRAPDVRRRTLRISLMDGHPRDVRGARGSPDAHADSDGDTEFHIDIDTLAQSDAVWKPHQACRGDLPGEPLLRRSRLVTGASSPGDACGYDVTQPVTLAGGTQITHAAIPGRRPAGRSQLSSPQALGIDGGLMDGWLGIPGCGATSTIVGSVPVWLPHLSTHRLRYRTCISLATNFVVSDETFSMADSPSWGGHVYSVRPPMTTSPATIPPSGADPTWLQSLDRDGVATSTR